MLNLKTFIFHFITCLPEQIEVGLTQSIVDESEVSPLDVVGILKLVSIIHNVLLKLFYIRL